MGEGDERPNHMMGALAGGALMGILSTIPCVNICCMLWGVIGGVLAAYVAAQRPPFYGPGDGAISGLCAAGAGWLGHSLVNVPLGLLMGSLMKGQPQQPLPPEVPPWVADLLKPGSPMAVAIGQVVYLGIFLVTGAIGGVVGGLIFKKEPKDIV